MQRYAMPRGVRMASYPVAKPDLHVCVFRLWGHSARQPGPRALQAALLHEKQPVRRLQALILLWPSLIFSCGLPDNMCLNVWHVTDMWRVVSGVVACGPFSLTSQRMWRSLCVPRGQNWSKLAMVPALGGYLIGQPKPSRIRRTLGTVDGGGHRNDDPKYKYMLWSCMYINW